jgi:rubrerythrin
MTDPKAEKDGQKKDRGSIFGFHKPAEQKKGKYVTVKEEKKHLKRVVKARPMSRKHMADSFKADAVTEEDMMITQNVIEQVSAPVAAQPKPAVALTFTCYQCGAQVSFDSERCPRCKSFYLKNLRDEDVDELLRAEQMRDTPLDDFVERANSPVVHFDAETGVMHFLEADKGEPDFVFECAHCGTVVELNTDRCPICGTKLELGDTGLVGMFTDMEFDAGPLDDADCPFCGEKVSLDSGKCPACSNDLGACGDCDPAHKVRPVLRAENVVFLHLDIVTGEINFLQRNTARHGYDQVSVQLDGIGNGGFEQDWSSLSRI